MDKEQAVDVLYEIRTAMLSGRRVKIDVDLRKLKALDEAIAALRWPAQSGYEPRPAARDGQVGGDHYRKLRYQPWDVLPDWLKNMDGFTGYLVGSAVGYLSRFPEKGKAEDVKKARHYLDRLVEFMESGK